MKQFIAILFVVTCSFGALAEEKKLEKGPDVVHIFMHQVNKLDGSTKFYMTIGARGWMVLNTAPDVSVGCTFRTGYLYLSSEKIGLDMFFIYPYNPKEENIFNQSLTVKFGGNRPNDINIYLPPNTIAKTHVVTHDEEKEKK